MGLLETFIIAVGGPTLLIGAVAYMAKSLLSQWLAKELKRHESGLNQESKQFELELKAKYDSAAERLKNELQLKAGEHQVRFSKLHERRAEVIAEAYRLLVVALWDVESALAPLQLANDVPLKEKYNAAYNKLVDFYRYFDVHKLYLPPETCKTLDGMFANIRSTLVRFGTYLQLDNAHLPEHVYKEKMEQQLSAWHLIRDEVPKARESLESELRSLLGDIVSDSNA
ncbi:hypothetical protein QTN24_01415 [Cupriavidus sp. SZY C1]|uniref:hypothetical protein n=1 Tax=Cupriavidus sp. SZY C1 TaxID=3055037 RepID=UPI0028B778C1|nr:hypothetical protein [Cupriavidus sp. SZY C1]MDT6960143.1 hypothetical protein [Cupriavidus sp. SZY C1]